MDNIEIITENTRETQWAGRILAEEIVKSGLRREKALIIGMEGDLGSGKTTFIQGMAKELGIKESITSPTFVILKKYKIPVPNSKKTRLPRSPDGLLATTWLYHIDCYRIKPKDLLELGFEEISGDCQNIIVIEWAERVKKILKNVLWIKFEYVDKDKRKIIITNQSRILSLIITNLRQIIRENSR